MPAGRTSARRLAVEIGGAVVGFVVALVAFQAGQPMLAAHIGDVVPW